MSGGKTKSNGQHTCAICRKHRPGERLIPAELIHGGVGELIRREHPDWGRPGDLICGPDLNHYRARYVGELIAQERGELTALDTEVVQRLQMEQLVSENTNVEFDRALSFGERISDRVARFGGSWTFIISFGCFLAFWMLVNAHFLMAKPFDPYPFILLNLVLSTVAALQAPVIMMSQNRQEAKDRLRAEHDYQVNLKAELEIRLLGERIDALLNHQWQRLLEIQQIQIELMNELVDRRRSRG